MRWIMRLGLKPIRNVAYLPIYTEDPVVAADEPDEKKDGEYHLRESRWPRYENNTPGPAHRLRIVIVIVFVYRVVDCSIAPVAHLHPENWQHLEQAETAADQQVDRNVRLHGAVLQMLHTYTCIETAAHIVMVCSMDTMAMATDTIRQSWPVTCYLLRVTYYWSWRCGQLSLVHVGR